jgi:hypothetical protein
MSDSLLREILPAIFLLALTASTASAQQDIPRFEVGVQFSLLSLNQPSKLITNPIDPGFIGFAPSNRKRTEPGFGGRFTYNLIRSLAFEAEGNLFPRSEFSSIAANGVFEGGFGAAPRGRVFQGQFGVKAGKRFRRFGIFGKARPGFVGFTKVNKLLSTTSTAPAGPLNQVFTVGTFGVGKKAYFSVDLGAVVEYYVSRRIFARFDLGDTVIHYQSFPGPGAFLSRAIIIRPPETRHNLQFNAGVGFRF